MKVTKRKMTPIIFLRKLSVAVEISELRRSWWPKAKDSKLLSFSPVPSYSSSGRNPF